MRRGPAPPFDWLRVVSKALREPQGREHVESVEPQREPMDHIILDFGLPILD